MRDSETGEESMSEIEVKTIFLKDEAEMKTTLRDRFAMSATENDIGAAMTGHRDEMDITPYSVAERVAARYRYAGAMLEARKR